MKKILIIVALLCATESFSQNRFTIKVVDAVSKEPLAGASVHPKGVESLLSTRKDGTAEIILPVTSLSLIITHVSYVPKEVLLKFPLQDSLLIIEMEQKDEEEEEVIVQSTRTSRNIKNVPTRVETIELEEIDEKSNMRPANVSMLLHESTGILVQQTSATSANASIRLQGLDGRYTQLLKDGFASFGNSPAGFKAGRDNKRARFYFIWWWRYCRCYQFYF